MGSSTFTRLASALPVLACMCAPACWSADELDPAAELRNADELRSCSEVYGTIGLLAEQDHIQWVDGEQSLSDQQLLIGVGSDASVTLCMDFAEFGGLARVSSADGSQLQLGGKGDTVSCVVLLRPASADATGELVLDPLELHIEMLEAEPVAGDELDFYLAPVKSSGKVKIVDTCPKFDLTYP